MGRAAALVACIVSVLGCAAPPALSDTAAAGEERDTLLLDRWPAYNAEATFCNIPRRQATKEEFFNTIMGREPVILSHGAGRDTIFRNLTTRASLLNHFADLTVTLSSANSYSYDKRRVSMRTYLETMVGDATLDRRGNATFYLFGDTFGDDWDALLHHFPRPPWQGGSAGALSFGAAGRFSGVPFHTHGAVYADLQHGRKRWFLYPPGHAFRFDPDRSQWQWLNEEYPLLAPADRPAECTARPGETLYIPPMWWHATLNLDPHTVFVSTFVDEPHPGDPGRCSGSTCLY